VLAIVEEEQHSSALEPAAQRALDIRMDFDAHAKRGGNRVRNERAFSQRAQVDEPDAVGIALEHGAAEFECQPGFANAAAAGQRQQTTRVQQPRQLGDIVRAANECGELCRQVVTLRRTPPERAPTLA
jgi:hypothetical protein